MDAFVRLILVSKFSSSSMLVHVFPGYFSRAKLSCRQFFSPVLAELRPELPLCIRKRPLGGWVREMGWFLDGETGV